MVPLDGREERPVEVLAVQLILESFGVFYNVFICLVTAASIAAMCVDEDGTAMSCISLLLETFADNFTDKVLFTAIMY